MHCGFIFHTATKIMPPFIAAIFQSAGTQPGNFNFLEKV
jgi:hypothetical protein